MICWTLAAHWILTLTASPTTSEERNREIWQITGTEHVAVNSLTLQLIDNLMFFCDCRNLFRADTFCLNNYLSAIYFTSDFTHLVPLPRTQDKTIYTTRIKTHSPAETLKKRHLNPTLKRVSSRVHQDPEKNTSPNLHSTKCVPLLYPSGVHRPNEEAGQCWPNLPHCNIYSLNICVAAPPTSLHGRISLYLFRVIKPWHIELSQYKMQQTLADMCWIKVTMMLTLMNAPKPNHYLYPCLYTLEKQWSPSVLLFS